MGTPPLRRRGGSETHPQGEGALRLQSMCSEWRERLRPSRVFIFAHFGKKQGPGKGPGLQPKQATSRCAQKPRSVSGEMTLSMSSSVLIEPFTLAMPMR